MAQARNDDRTLAEEIGLLVSIVLRRKWRVLSVFVVAFVLSASSTYLVQPRYTSTALVLPGASGLNLGGMLGELTALSGIAGLDVGGSGVDLYPIVAKSNTIVSRVLATGYDSSTVLSVLLNGKPEDARSVERIKRELRTKIVTAKDLRSGSLRFEYTHRDPDFAAFVLNTVLDNLDTYFRESSGVEAREHRQLIESRISAVGAEVELVENELKEFRIANRAVASSPLLALEEGRLLRQVEIKNRVYLELAGQLEVARIREAGSVTVIKVLDRATRPQDKSWPRRSAFVLASVCLIGGAYIGWLRWRHRIEAIESTV